MKLKQMDWMKMEDAKPAETIFIKKLNFLFILKSIILLLKTQI